MNQSCVMDNKAQCKTKVNLFLFKRDLRLEDNVGLFHTLSKFKNVLLIYIFEPEETRILNSRQESFVYDQLKQINKTLQDFNSSVLVRRGDCVEILQSLCAKYFVESISFNVEYDPVKTKEELKIREWSTIHRIGTYFYHDSHIMPPGKILKDDGSPYVVFSAYKRKWLSLLDFSLFDVHSTPDFIHLCSTGEFLFPSAKVLRIQENQFVRSESNLSDSMFENYELLRNIPSAEGTSKLSVSLRFGLVSIRKIVREVYSKWSVFLSELIWREFFTTILWYFPNTQYTSFKPAYEAILWRNDEGGFKLWSTGNTGYSLVDAGMRELNESGLMHNRVRMVASSFLCKHLLIDWRLGEAYFAEKLLDYDRAANIGNWQWVCGSGCDAMPYNRVFNPIIQQSKFDPDYTYVKKWVREYEGDYCSVIIEHTFARNRALSVYKEGLEKGRGGVL